MELVQQHDDTLDILERQNVTLRKKEEMYNQGTGILKMCNPGVSFDKIGWEQVGRWICKNLKQDKHQTKYQHDPIQIWT